MEKEELKDEIIRLEKIIADRDETIVDLRENIHMHIWIGLLQVSNEFSILLNPPPTKIKGTYKNKSNEYSLKVEDIVHITAKGRYKEIWLRNRVPGRGETERNTDMVLADYVWDDLMKRLDSMKFHFVKVEKGAYVNVKYFRIDKRSIVTEGSEKLPKHLKGIIYNLDKSRMDKFIPVKENYNRVSLQKTEFRDISKKMKRA